MKRLVHRLVAVAATLMLGACAGTMPGQFNGLGDDPLPMLIVYSTDGNGTLTEKQYADVVQVAKRMGGIIEMQFPSSLEAAASSGLAYGAAGISGGVSILATISAVSGAVGGFSTASYAIVYAVSDATETAMRDAEKKGDTRYTDLHVVASFVRSRNSEKSPAPKLVQNRN